MNPAVMLHELLSMVWRRFWVIAVVTTLGTGAAVATALMLPPMYQTEAKILVESQRIPTELARSTVNSSAAERLQLIEQRLMSRDRLIEVIEKLGLFADRAEMTLLDKIDALREATRIRPIGLAGGGRRETSISAFTIRVTLGDPRQAAAIVNEFVEIVLEQNLEARSERARQTLAFFEGEERRLAAALTAIEREISDFKVANEDALPDSLEFRRSELARLHDSSLELDRRVLELEERRGVLEASLAGGGTPDAPLRPTQEAQRLRALRLELAERRQLLAPGHPELVELRRRIGALEGFIEDEAVRAGGADGTAPDPRAAALRRQIDLVGTQISVIREQQQELAERRVDILRSIQATPEVEIALNGLQRRHTELREQYAAAVRKRAEAETGEKLEANQQAERFEVIETALVPQDPISPNRKKIAALGFAASGALAGVLMLVLEMLNPAIRSTAQMERRLQLRPVVSIPYVRTRAERRHRQRVVAAAAAVVVVVVPSGLWVVDRHVRPLESVAERIVERAGLSGMVEAVRARF